ncbi:hypothetical protein MGSAQ_001549 [marine sediment metagenome]|uniref:Uncharacterized protein n=1 Tax=marine sediment metagenome TaxID=412755 RepID=A0A1B6NU04_9ZZZZ
MTRPRAKLWLMRTNYRIFHRSKNYVIKDYRQCGWHQK